MVLNVSAFTLTLVAFIFIIGIVLLATLIIALAERRLKRKIAARKMAESPFEKNSDGKKPASENIIKEPSRYKSIESLDNLERIKQKISEQNSLFANRKKQESVGLV